MGCSLKIKLPFILYCFSFRQYSQHCYMLYYAIIRLIVWNVNSSHCTNLCSASKRRLSTWRCPHLMLSAGACCMHGARSCRSIPCPQGAQQQTCRPPLLLSIDGTDGRTDARPLHRPCCAGSVNNRKSSTKYGEVLTSSTPLLCPVFACRTRMPNIHVHAVQFITPTTIGERSIVMSVSVRLSVCVYLNIFSLVNYFCKTVTN